MRSDHVRSWAKLARSNKAKSSAFRVDWKGWARFGKKNLAR